jgi:quercetin dioxygenase-like cupin family protein
MSARPPVLNVQQTDWSAIPAERIADGIERQLFYGDRVMVCRLVIAPRTVTPVHSHPHEQITMVERGRVRYIIEGQERVLEQGDMLHLPSGIAHGATMLDEEVVLIDIFSPLREDFLPVNGDGPR